MYSNINNCLINHKERITTRGCRGKPTSGRLQRPALMSCFLRQYISCSLGKFAIHTHTHTHRHVHTPGRCMHVCCKLSWMWLSRIYALCTNSVDVLFSWRFKASYIYSAALDVLSIKLCLPLHSNIYHHLSTCHYHIVITLFFLVTVYTHKIIR